MKPATVHSPLIQPLTYGPAYLGLYAALLLAVACNAFLDIQYGSFLFEVIFWGLLFAFGLLVGWGQRGEPSSGGKKAQRWVLGIGMLLALLIFVRLWGFPRAGLAMLLMLQAAQNCVCVSRRQLYLGLLVSLVAVVFAASHYRADWTMLFYLLPYVVAVVFTLVAEQVNRRSVEIRRDSLGSGLVAGQGMAILFATVVILGLGGLLYSLTPQPTWTSLMWKYGQPGGSSMQGPLFGAGQGTSADGQADAGQGDGQWQPGDGAEMPAAGLSIQDMRDAARRPGMPGWQSASIEALADGAESLGQIWQPLRLGLDELWQAFKEWLKEHQQVLSWTLFALLVLALLLAAWRLIRELRLVLWLRVQLDYLWLRERPRAAAGNRAAQRYYRAVQRLLDLHELEVPPAANSREYLAQVQQQFRHLGEDAQALTLIFEKARYSAEQVSADELASMHGLYQRLFRRIDIINALEA